MGKLFYWGFIIGILVVAVLGVKNLMEQTMREAESNGQRSSARVDGMLAVAEAANEAADAFTGKPHVIALNKAKTAATKLDLTTYKTAITMFYTQNNRYPKDLQELYKAKMIGSDAMKDPWGQPFRSEVKNNKLIIYSSGQSKISHTGDDIWAEIPLQ